MGATDYTAYTQEEEEKVFSRVGNAKAHNPGRYTIWEDPLPPGTARARVERVLDQVQPQHKCPHCSFASFKKDTLEAHIEACLISKAEFDRREAEGGLDEMLDADGGTSVRPPRRDAVSEKRVREIVQESITPVLQAISDLTAALSPHKAGKVKKKRGRPFKHGSATAHQRKAATDRPPSVPEVASQDVPLGTVAQESNQAEPSA